ncbi:MAG: hypothetical protein A2046_03825 [Bacteroidetes bacterium GWA2_30_7]|nr:MAG: hypothetical protein A2046_03825 [Bacteroidetes bacterium GWA2_30_7]
MLKFLFLILILIVTKGFIFCQSLLDELNSENNKIQDTVFTNATFKSTKIINGQSIETVGKNELNFIISHRFGNINSGVHQFYGLDQSFIRFGLEYGLNKKIDIGIGRSREQELVDGYIKIKLLSQAKGGYNMPLTITLYSSIAVKMQKWVNPEVNYKNIHRLFYVNELLIARKFSDKISLQLAPGFVHRNLTLTKQDKNLIPYIGLAGRYKISKRIALSSEYYWVYPEQTSFKIYNPFSVGIDIETGGHVFQLHFSNSRGMHEKMIPENLNNWQNGDFGFGFNIVRHFNLNRNNNLKY